MSTCLEGIRPRNVEYREYYKNGRRVKEYIITIEMNMDTDKNDPIARDFLYHMLSILYSEAMGGGPRKLGILLCRTDVPPGCPSLIPPNGKALLPVSNYRGSVWVDSMLNYVVVYITAIDDSTDSYSWDNVIIQWATPVSFETITYSYIAYVSTTGRKESSDILYVQFAIKLSASFIF